MEMTSGRIAPAFVKFSIPLLLGNLFQFFYSTTDILIVGNYCDTASLAAIGASANIIFTLTGFFNGLANGAGVLVAHLYGAKDGNKIRKTIRTVLPLSLALGIILSSAGFFIAPLMLKMISVPDDVFPKAIAYLRIYFAGLTFVLFYSICTGILRSLGDSKRPLYILFLTVLLNVILDFLFILKLKTGLEGAAWATIISEFVSAIFAFFILLKRIKVEVIFSAVSNQICTIGFVVRSVLKLGLPSAISNSILNFSNTFMQRYINFFGSDCMAGWAVYTRFDQLTILPMVSICMAATTFTAQNYGAGKIDRVKKGIRVSSVLGFSVVLVISSILIIFARPLISVFNSKEEVVSYGSQFMRAAAFFYVFCFGAMLFCQISQGLGSTVIPTSITFFGFVIFRQIYLFSVSHIFNSSLLIALAYPFAWPPSMLLEIWYLKKKLSRLITY
ncbi:MATE family efflux transporter [Treponema bryantii]|uniref:MATE family efflux transporter n=1 Tax=Treponema bryantii TaxID=163 RepID=UPI0003B3F99D|nr:MATE family efflux transporter [Treponema bryantii]